MHGTRARFDVLPTLDIEQHADLIVGNAYLLRILALEDFRLLAHPLGQGHKLPARVRTVVELGDGVRLARLGVLLGVCSSMKRAYSISINRHVIGMSEATRLVERDHNLRAELTNHRDQLSNDSSGTGGDEGAGVLVRRRTSHARVAKAKKLQMLHTQHVSRRPHLSLTHLAEILGRRQHRIEDLSHLATRRVDQAGLNTK